MQAGRLCSLVRRAATSRAGTESSRWPISARQPRQGRHVCSSHAPYFFQLRRSEISLVRRSKSRPVDFAPTELVRKSEAFGYKHHGPPGLRVAGDTRLGPQFRASEGSRLAQAEEVVSGGGLVGERHREGSRVGLIRRRNRRPRGRRHGRQRVGAFQQPPLSRRGPGDCDGGELRVAAG